MAFSNRSVSGLSSASVITLIQQNVVISEALTGTLDGVNTVFTTSSAVSGTSIDVFSNGAEQTAGGVDYTFSLTNTVTFVVAPVSSGVGGQQPRATYVKA